MTPELNRFTAVLFDMDGVLYRGSRALPGVGELLAFLDARGVAYACCTNNATMTPAQYEAKLAQMGISIPATRIVTSSVATRRWLETQAPRGTGIFAVGMDGLRSALFDDGYFVEDEEHPAFVVVGMDFEVTYRRLRKACLLIRAGARFVGTNPDTTFPAEDGIVPGCGALLALLRVSTDIEPFVIGKPGPTMFHTAIEILGADAMHTLTIGDRLDTDIAGARAARLAGALVLTGVTTPEMLERSAIQPDFIFRDLVELREAWMLAPGG